MTNQRILLGDCLDVLADQRNVPAIVADPPANIAFMGRSWDRAHPVNDYVLPCTPRSKAHERELRSEESFIRYWHERYAMAYDIADQHASAIIWTLPRTSYQTATAMRRAGWYIQDNLVHLFGTGWAKTGNALAPGQEGWLLATKGKPDLDIDACRVPRGERPVMAQVTPNRNSAINGMQLRGRSETGETTSLGSLPKNALLSHCEECVRVGSRDVKGTASKDNRGKPHGANKIDPRASLRDDVWEGFGATESVPAWHCLAGCVCGARSKWDPEKPLPRCPCGETWRWLCAVAEVNGQTGTLVSGYRQPWHAESSLRHVYSGKDHNGGKNGKTNGGDAGGGARFFNTFSYLSKCSSSERHAGCENLYWRENKKNAFGFDQITREEYEANCDWVERKSKGKVERVQVPRKGYARGNVHATVKGYELMHWHHSLTGAEKVVDLCAGSGTGMITAALDGIEWIGAEMCPEAVTIAQARHAFWSGLSHEARRAMVEESIVPSRFEPDERQRSLF